MKLLLKVTLSTIIVMLMAPGLSRLESVVVVWLLTLLTSMEDVWRRQ